jgi:hypothetical protein
MNTGMRMVICMDMDTDVEWIIDQNIVRDMGISMSMDMGKGMIIGKNIG